MNTLLQFGSKTGIHLDGNDLFALFQDLDRQVSCTGTNFEHSVGGAQVGLMETNSSVSENIREGKKHSHIVSILSPPQTIIISGCR